MIGGIAKNEEEGDTDFRFDYHIDYGCATDCIGYTVWICELFQYEQYASEYRRQYEDNGRRALHDHRKLC